MALTPSTMLPLNTRAPNFNLPDAISGQVVSLSAVKSKIATVIMFICNHCPYVIHIQKKLAEVANQYQAKGIKFIAINSNDVSHYPADSPEQMKLIAEKIGYNFPYLYDESQEIAKAYQAACTPDFYIFDKDLRCVYRGRFDNSSPGKPDVAVTGKDLTAALDQILNNQPIDENQLPSVGCNIKWKK